MSIDRVTGVVVNDSSRMALCTEVAARLVGEDRVDPDMEPMMGGDDFRYMSERVPACYVFIGNGDTPGLHTTEYDFNDEIIPTGVSYWVTLAQTATSRES